MKTMLTILTLIFFLTDAKADFRPWPRSSSPTIMGQNFKLKFSELPLVGQAIGSKKYWSSFYWPLNKGNINLRWNAPIPIGHNLVSPNREEAMRMSRKELEILSPSEKFDLWRGQYSYPLKKAVAAKASPLRKDWEGICHGWAAAALNHNEPTSKIMTNADGLKVPFGSSDIKALLSYYYAYIYNPVSTHQMGRRCNGQRNCTYDLNAGAFHLALANKVGVNGESFIADMENGREVWNHVIYSFNSKIIGPERLPSDNSAEGTVKVVRLKTRMRIVFNIIRNSWSPVIGTPLQAYKDYDYEYDLDINEKGKIIGGDWISKERPDFIWSVKPASKFNGMFSKLGELLNE